MSNLSHVAKQRAETVLSSFFEVVESVVMFLNLKVNICVHHYFLLMCTLRIPLDPYFLLKGKIRILHILQPLNQVHILEESGSNLWFNCLLNVSTHKQMY